MSNAAYFVTKDSGAREEFSTGAKRDIQDDKTRWDLVPLPPLKRLADLYQRGAAKYGLGNFERGMPFSRVYASLLRHLFEWRQGHRDEDTLAGVAWNAFALMLYEEKIRLGELPRELDDLNVFVPSLDKATENNASSSEVRG